MPKEYSDQELLQHIRDLADGLEHTPTKTEMNEAKGYPSTTPYYNQFDSWTDAVEQAGLDPNEGGEEKKVLA